MVGPLQSKPRLNAEIANVSIPVRLRFEKWLRWISTEFADRLLPVDEKVADRWGRLVSLQPVLVLDAFLATTPLVHGLVVVSRDEEGLRHTDVRVINQFSKSTEK